MAGTPPVTGPGLVDAEDWTGGRRLWPWTRPDTWRGVACQLNWDVAVVAAAWAHLEAVHQRPERQRAVLAVTDALARTVADDLPYLAGVGPSAPAGHPSLPLDISGDPPLEPLGERPEDLSWRMYFWLALRQQTGRILERAEQQLAAIEWARDQVSVEMLSDLAVLLVEQVALQLECLLRGQDPPAVALLEEALSLRIEDAALGGAVHVEVDDDEQPIALRLTSYEGRTRAPVWLPPGCTRDDDLYHLVAALVTGSRRLGIG